MRISVKVIRGISAVEFSAYSLPRSNVRKTQPVDIIPYHLKNWDYLKLSEMINRQKSGLMYSCNNSTLNDVVIYWGMCECRSQILDRLLLGW